MHFNQHEVFIHSQKNYKLILIIFITLIFTIPGLNQSVPEPEEVLGLKQLFFHIFQETIEEICR